MGEVLRRKGLVVRENPDPLPVLAIIGGMIAEKLVERAVDIVVDKVTKPADTMAELGTKLAMYKAFKGMAIDAAIDAIRYAFFTDPRADDTGYNIDYDRFKDVMDKLMYATIVLETLISEDASELTMEMLQESLSNSLQYGLGGMWALMSAYASGFGIPQGLTFVGENDIHPYTLASVDAWTGQLKHFLAAQHYVRVKDEWEQAHQHDVHRWIAKGVEIAEMPNLVIASRVLAKAFDMVERMADMVTEMVSVMLRRTHDLAYSLMAAYNDYKAGILSDYEFLTIAKSISNAIDAIDQELDNLMADAYHVGQYVNATFTDDSGEAHELLTELSAAIQQTYYGIVDRMNATINKELAEKLAKYIEALNDIRKKSGADVYYTATFDGVKTDCYAQVGQGCETQAPGEQEGGGGRG